MLFSLFLIFILTDLNLIKAEGYDSSEARYIDELPEKEKKDFITRIARRIIEDNNTKDVNDGINSGDVISDELLNVHSSYVSKLLREEAENLKKRRSQNNETTVNSIKDALNHQKTDGDAHKQIETMEKALEKIEGMIEDESRKSGSVLEIPSVDTTKTETEKIDDAEDTKASDNKTNSDYAVNNTQKDENDGKSNVDVENIKSDSVNNKSEKILSQNDTKPDVLITRSEDNPLQETDKSIKTVADKSEDNNNEEDLTLREDTDSAPKLTPEIPNQATIDLTLRKSNENKNVSQNETQLLDKNDDKENKETFGNKVSSSNNSNKKIGKNEPVSIEITIFNDTDSSNESKDIKKDQIPVQVLYDDDKLQSTSKTGNLTAVERQINSKDNILKNSGKDQEEIKENSKQSKPIDEKDTKKPKNSGTDQEKVESKENSKPSEPSEEPDVMKPKRAFRKSLMDDKFDEKENSQRKPKSEENINENVTDSAKLAIENSEKREENLTERVSSKSTDKTVTSQGSIPTRQFSETNGGLTTVSTSYTDQEAVETKTSTPILVLHTAINDFDPNENETYTNTTPNPNISTTEEIVKMRTEFVTGWPPESDIEKDSVEKVSQPNVAQSDKEISNGTQSDQTKSILAQSQLVEPLVNLNITQNDQAKSVESQLNSSQPNLDQPNQAQLEAVTFKTEDSNLGKTTVVQTYSQTVQKDAQSEQTQINISDSNQYPLNAANFNKVQSNLAQKDEAEANSVAQKTEPRTILAEATGTQTYQDLSNASSNAPNVIQKNTNQTDKAKVDVAESISIKSTSQSDPADPNAEELKIVGSSESQTNVGRSEAAQSDITEPEASQSIKTDIIEDKNPPFNTSFYANKLSSISQMDVARSDEITDLPHRVGVTISNVSKPEVTMDIDIPQAVSKQPDLLEEKNEHSFSQSDPILRNTDQEYVIKDNVDSFNTSFYQNKLSNNVTDLVDSNDTTTKSQIFDKFIDKNIYVNTSFYKNKISSDDINIARSNGTELAESESEKSDTMKENNTYFNTSFYEHKLSNDNLIVNPEKNADLMESTTKKTSISDLNQQNSERDTIMRSISESAKKDKQNTKSNQGDYSIKEIGLAINIKVDKNEITTSAPIMPLTTTKAGIIKKEFYYPIETPVVILNDSIIIPKNHSEFVEHSTQNIILYGAKGIPANMPSQALQPDLIFEAEKMSKNGLFEMMRKSQLTKIIDNVRDILKNVNKKMGSGDIIFLEKPEGKPKNQLNPLNHFPKQPLIVNEVLPGQKLFEEVKPKIANPKNLPKPVKSKTEVEYSDESNGGKSQTEPPRYAPVHDYDPKNAYYNPYNLYRPNEGDEGIKIVDERSIEEKRKVKELEKVFDYEINKKEANDTDDTSNLNIELPKYAPVHNYDSKNAYFNPKNIYALNSEDEKAKIVDERSKEIDPEELEKTFDYEIQKPLESSKKRPQKSKGTKLINYFKEKLDEIKYKFGYETQKSKKRPIKTNWAEDIVKFFEEKHLTPVIWPKNKDKKKTKGSSGKSRYSVVHNSASKNVQYSDDFKETEKTFDYEVQVPDKPSKLLKKFIKLLERKENNIKSRNIAQSSAPVSRHYRPKKINYDNEYNGDDDIENDSNEAKETFDYEIQRAPKLSKFRTKLNSKDIRQENEQDWIDYDYYFGGYNRDDFDKIKTLRKNNKRQERACDDDSENCRIVCGDVCGEKSVEQKPKKPPNSDSEEHPYNALLNKNPPLAHIQQVGIILGHLGHHDFVDKKRGKTSTTTEPSSDNENWVGPDLDLFYNKKIDSPGMQQNTDKQSDKPLLRVANENSNERNMLIGNKDEIANIYSYLKDKINLVLTAKDKLNTKHKNKHKSKHLLKKRPIILLTGRIKNPRKRNLTKTLFKYKPIKLETSKTQSSIHRKSHDSKEVGDDESDDDGDDPMDVSSSETSELKDLRHDIVRIILEMSENYSPSKQRELIEAFRDQGLLYHPKEMKAEFEEAFKQIREISKMNEIKKPDLNITKELKTLRSDDKDGTLDEYVKVMTDMVRRDDTALKNYDWLTTTVDIRSALRKISQMIAIIREGGKEIHPKDLQILKYILYLHSTVDKPQEEEEDLSAPLNMRFSYTAEKSEELPKNLRFPIQHQKSRVWKKPKPARRQEKPWMTTKGLKERAVELSKLVEDLEDSLDELHDAIKHISLITKYKNQKWFENLKDLYMTPITPKCAIEVLLHLQATRVFSLIEDSAKDGLEDNYVKYAMNNAEQVEKEKKEFAFLVELVTGLKKLK